MNALGNYANNILKAALGLPRQNKQTFYPEDCPLVTAGMVYAHSYHCVDNSTEQIAATLNGIADMVVDVNENLITISENLYEEHKTIREKIFYAQQDIKKQSNDPSTSNSKLDNYKALLIDIQKGITDLLTGQEQLPSEMVAQTRAQINSSTKDILSKVKLANDKLELSNNSVLLELKEILETMGQDLKPDPNNPKPVELRIEQNAKEILSINKQIIPLMKTSNEVIRRSNDLLEETFKVLNQVKAKLGIDENI